MKKIGTLKKKKILNIWKAWKLFVTLNLEPFNDTDMAGKGRRLITVSPCKVLYFKHQNTSNNSTIQKKQTNKPFFKN